MYAHLIYGVWFMLWGYECRLLRMALYIKFSNIKDLRTN